MHACAFGFTSFVVSMRACRCLLRVRFTRRCICRFCLVLRIAALPRCNELDNRRAFHALRVQSAFVHKSCTLGRSGRPPSKFSVSRGFLDFRPDRRRPPLRFGATSPRIHAQAVTSSLPSAAPTNRRIGISLERGAQNGPAAPEVWRPPGQERMHACIRTFRNACIHAFLCVCGPLCTPNLCTCALCPAGRALCTYLWALGPAGVGRSSSASPTTQPTSQIGALKPETT